MSVRRVIALLTLSFLAVGCATGGGESVDAGEEDGTETVIDSVDESDETEPQDFRYAMTAVPTTLAPEVFEGQPTRTALYELGGTLFMWDPDAAGCETLSSPESLRGGLVEEWSVSEDGRVVEMTLREATSSFGNDLSAEDVRWTFERNLELSGVVQFLYSQVADYNEEPIRVTGDRTLELHINEPTPLDLAVQTWGQTVILDSQEAQQHATDDDPWAAEWLSENSATFGPWQITPENFRSGDEIVMEPNENYWGEAPAYSRLILTAIPEASTRAQLVQSGEVDYAAGLTFPQYEELAEHDDVLVQQCVSGDRDALVPRHDRAPLDDPEVRQALSMAIDREALLDGVYRGYGTVANDGLSSAYIGEGQGAAEMTHDPERARAILNDRLDGEELELGITVSSVRPGAHAEDLAVRLQAQLAEVGVTLNIEQVPGASEFNDVFYAGEFDTLLYVEPPAFAAPFYSMFLYNHSGSNNNTHGYASDEYDRLTEEIRTTLPGPELDELLADAATLIATDQPYVYLIDRSFMYAFHGTVGGYEHNPSGELFVAELTRSES